MGPEFCSVHWWQKSCRFNWSRNVFFLGQLLDLMEKKRTEDYRAFTDALETHYPHLFLSLTGPIDEIETGMCDIIYYIKLQRPFVCVGLSVPPFFQRRPLDRDQIWHACVGGSGNGSNLNKCAPSHRRRNFR